MPIVNALLSFKRGELSPELFGRQDLELYQTGLAEATNVVSVPQGGMKRRSGTRFIAEYPRLQNRRLERFSFNDDIQYLLAFGDQTVDVYRDDVLQTTLATPFSDPRSFDYVQSADSAILVNKSVAPQLLQRTSDTAWTMVDVPLINIPTFNFNDAQSPAPVDEIQTITFTNTTDGDRFKLSLDGILTEEIAYSKSDGATTALNMELALLELPNTGNDGVIVTDTGGEVYNFVFTGPSANDFSALIVVPVTSGNPSFKGATVINQEGKSSSEPVWSVTRGFPGTVTFHELRLWFGGSQSRPATLWGSVVDDPFNFDKGKARDDEGIDVTLATDEVNAIRVIISNRSLQIFTSGGEFFVPQSPITPSNVAVQAQTRIGAKAVRPEVIEGQTLYINRTGKALYQFQFVDETQSNEAKSLSLISKQLINNPVQMTSQRGTDTEDANYVYLVNSDGDMAVFNTQLFKGVAAFTRHQQDAYNIRSAAIVDESLYLYVESINGKDFIVKEVEGLTTDASVSTSAPSATIAGLDHLNGLTVDVKADGVFFGSFVVSGGEVTLARIVASAEAGLPYTGTLKTMPVFFNLSDGSNIAKRKRITRSSIELFESIGIYVNGEFISARTVIEEDSPAPPFGPPVPITGIRRLYLLGWGLSQQLTITMPEPFDAHVLALYLEISV